ncbi:MAG: hypothetical protein V1871_03425 [Planctomycetota bacterium]
MAKTNVSWWATIVVFFLIFPFGISISAMFVNLTLHREINTIDLILGLFFLGILPIVCGIFILVSRIQGKDYNMNELEDNSKISWFVKIMRLISGLLLTLIYFAIFMLLQTIETKSIWPAMVIIILQDMVIFVIMLYFFFSVGKIKYFREHKNKTWLRIIFILVILGLITLVHFLLKK